MTLLPFGSPLVNVTGSAAPGLTIYGNALQNFKKALGAVQQNTNYGLYGNGIDILTLTDSTGTTTDGDPRLDIWPHMLKLKLQKYYNPADVIGGYGFFPLLDDGSTAYPNIQGGGTTGTWTQNRLFSNNADGICRRNFTASTSGASAWYLFDTSTIPYVTRNFPPGQFLPTNPITTNIGFTSMEPVYQKLASGGTTGKIYYSQYSSNTPPYNVSTDSGSNGAVLAAEKTTISSDGAGTFSCGNKATRLVSSTRFWIQFSQTGTGSIPYEGAIYYAGDEQSGVRLHQLGHGGAVVTDYYGADNTTAGGRAIAGIQSCFAGGSGVGANYARLVILAFGTNENGTGATPTVTPAQFQTNLQALVTKIQSWPTNPDIMIYCHVARNDSGAYSRWAQYQAAMYAVAQASGCAVFDLWKFLGANTWNNSVVPYNLGKTDGVHLSSTGHEVVRDLMFAALTR